MKEIDYDMPNGDILWATKVSPFGILNFKRRKVVNN